MKERKDIETIPSFNRLMLLVRDPYREIMRQIESFFHTEADTIEYLADKYFLKPDMVIDTVNSISHYVQERIENELSK